MVLLWSPKENDYRIFILRFKYREEDEKCNQEETYDNEEEYDLHKGKGYVME